MITGTSGRAARIFSRSSSPLMPGILTSENTRISVSSPREVTRCRASLAEPAKRMANRPERSSRRNCCWKSEAKSGSSSTTRMRRFIPPPPSLAGPGQDDCELGECAGLGLDRNLTAMLFDNDVVAQRETKAGSLAGGLGREERVEDLGPDRV